MRISQRDRNLILLGATPLRERRQVVKAKLVARSEKLPRIEQVLERTKSSNKFVFTCTESNFSNSS